MIPLITFTELDPVADVEVFRFLATNVFPRGLTELVFDRWPDLTGFEGHTREDNLATRATFRGAGRVKEAVDRDAWPLDGLPRASRAYAVLRRDWESGTTTPVVWDDL